MSIFVLEKFKLSFHIWILSSYSKQLPMFDVSKRMFIVKYKCPSSEMVHIIERFRIIIGYYYKKSNLSADVLSGLLDTIQQILKLL